jgi:hypothetical protein
VLVALSFPTTSTSSNNLSRPMIGWLEAFVLMGVLWLIEVTFQEVRRHPGLETQRQWSDSAIRRTTPALLGLFSLVTLFTHRQMVQAARALRQAARYHERHPTFADALALVRKELWAQERTFCGSPAETDTIKVPRAYVERLTDAVCYAA